MPKKINSKQILSHGSIQGECTKQKKHSTFLAEVIMDDTSSNHFPI